MTITNDQARLEIRRQLVSQMTGFGIPLDEAEEITDVAMHACDQALDRIATVCAGAGPLSLTTLNLAFQLMAHQTADIIEVTSADLAARPDAIMGKVVLGL